MKNWFYLKSLMLFFVANPNAANSDFLGVRKVVAAKASTSIQSSTSKLSSVKNAFGHWKKHAAEFPEFVNAKQYVKGAKNFLHNSPAGRLMKTRANGDILKYHPGTNTFGVWMQQEFQELCLDLRME